MELYKRFTFQLFLNRISFEGCRQLVAYLQAQNLPALPEDWQWLWLVERGEYAGTFPKRAARYYFKRRGIKLAQSVLAELGNLARRHAYEDVLYIFELVDRFDWHAGDFGDGSSCFWGSNAAAREMLADNNALAICFYDADGDGYARAWIAVLESDALFIVFNGYGLSTLKIAAVFAAWLGLEYRGVYLSNNGTPHGTLYINGGQGYAVGAPDALDFARHDLEWADDGYYTCVSCGRSLNEDELYTGADDEYYCDDCYYEQFDTCEDCGEVRYRDDLDWVDDRLICVYCRNRYYEQCDSCYEYLPKGTLYSVVNLRLCEECYRRDYTEET